MNKQKFQEKQNSLLFTEACEAYGLDATNVTLWVVSQGLY